MSLNRQVPDASRTGGDGRRQSYKSLATCSDEVYPTSLVHQETVGQASRLSLKLRNACPERCEGATQRPGIGSRAMRPR
jgi:hypothetical protein